MDTVFAIAVGVGLSAACGFRVFVPLLMMNLMAMGGYLNLSPEFSWIGSPYATAAFATATAVEVVGYYVPWVDHLLDIAAGPAAVIAGTIATASMIVDLPPFLKWTLSLIAGGGIAGLVQGSTAALRLKSSLSTAGAANPVFSTLEIVGSIVTSLLAVLAPALGLILIGLFLFFILRKAGRFILRKMKSGGMEGG